MRALAGPAMLIVVVGGFALHRAFSEPEAPPRSFLDAELAAPQNEDGHEGTCYSLSTVIIASTMYRSWVISWKPAGKNAWELSLDDVENGSSGPQTIYQKYTFEERDDLIHLTGMTASEGYDTDLVRNIDELVKEANSRSTPVDRCREPGATGYKFKPRR